jgi:hypothetical protein
MFDILDGVTQAWREVAHISEITGMSVFTLVACALLVYFDPTARKFAIHTAAVVVAGYCLFIFAYHQGSDDKGAQWAAANAQADEARKARDAEVSKTIASQYEPQIAALNKQSADLKRQVASYEKSLLTDKSRGSSLGAAPLRLRNGR